ncbi:MAG: TatD family hydrolase [Pseudoflavonifractor sp.]|nr:TatD family hydrolase [Pseudoflavonifractor sp.]
MIVDTHTHLYLDEFAGEEDAVVTSAIDAGVGQMIFPNVDLSTIEPMKRLWSRYPDRISMAMGLHPTEVGADWPKALAKVEEELRHGGYVAVGEIGIDLYWDKAYRAEQSEALRRQLELAVELSLPAILHVRDGLDDTLAVLESMEKRPAAVFHSFGGTIEDVARIRQVGDFYFGINGIVTFKNSRLREVLPAIGLDRILLETDAPYLSPVPHRGKRNESAYIVHTAAHIAQTLGITTEEVGRVTTLNAVNLFGIKICQES